MLGSGARASVATTTTTMMMMTTALLSLLLLLLLMIMMMVIAGCPLHRGQRLEIHRSQAETADARSTTNYVLVPDAVDALVDADAAVVFAAAAAVVVGMCFRDSGWKIIHTTLQTHVYMYT